MQTALPHPPPPQDVHPQHFQGSSAPGPAPPQWGMQRQGHVPSNAGPPPPPPPDWTQNLAPVDSHIGGAGGGGGVGGGPGRNPYDRGEPLRGPPPPSARQPSPRPDQLRQYQERPGSMRRPSPPPMSHGPAPHGIPASLPPQVAPTRIFNPNYANPANGMNTPPAGHNPSIPSSGRHSPPPDIKPIQDDRTNSPAGALPHMHSSRGPMGYQPPPPPMSVPPASSYPNDNLRDREERPSTGFKRLIDSEEDYKLSNKKQANGETRSRLDDDSYHRRSPRQTSPGHTRRSSSEIRMEPDRNYHPSEAAAHHPSTLPLLQHGPPAHPHTPQPINQIPPPPPPPPPPAPPTQQQPQQQLPPQPHTPSIANEQPTQPPASEAKREERREVYDEAPRRKMDVDEDYDDAGDDEKKSINSRKASPRSVTNNNNNKAESG